MPRTDAFLGGGTLPTWRYWAGVTLVAPLLLMGGFLLAITEDRSSLWWPLSLAMTGAVVAAALHERRIRTMPAARRAVWVAVGLALAAAVTYVLFVAVALIALSDSCLGAPDCF